MHDFANEYRNLHQIMTRKTSYTLLFLILGLSLKAQIGTEFWFAAPDLEQKHAEYPIRFCITSYNEPATVTFSQPANQDGYEPQTFYLAPNSFETYDVSDIIGIVETQPYNTVVNYGFRITSSSPVSIYYESNNNNSEIYTLKGSNALGKSFVVSTQHTYPNKYSTTCSRAEFVAVYDNTSVTIVSDVPLKGDIPAGQPVTVTLNRGQSYAVEAASNAPEGHLKGTRITSDKPIAVNSSDDSATGSDKHFDLVGDQLVPTDLLGMEYFTVRSGDKEDRLYIYPIQSDTKISINGNQTATLSIGEDYMYQMADDVCHITSDKPISVFQLTVNESDEMGGTVLPQIQCTGSNVVLYRRPEIGGGCKMIVTIVIETKNTDGFIVNGDANIIKASDFSEVPSNHEYSYCRKDISNHIPVNSIMRIENTHRDGYFQLGVLSANVNTCTYGFFSDYNEFSKIMFRPDKTDYCEGDDLVLDYTGVNVINAELFGPNGVHVNEFPFTISNITADDAGTYYLRGIDEIGCIEGYVENSIEIAVHEHPDIYLPSDTICLGDEYEDQYFHFEGLDVGNHTFTNDITDQYGCSSTVYLDLYVAPTYYTAPDIDTICEDDDYTNYGLNIQQPEPGTYNNIISELETELGCDSIFDVSFVVTAKLKSPDTLYGPSNVFVVTDLLPGKYKYSIDPIDGCDEYHWELDNEKWGMYPNMNECIIIVTTPEVCTLTVWASNSCNTVSKSIDIYADFFGVDENEAAGANVYPNPSDGYVNIEAEGIEVVNIVNASGTVMKTFVFEREDLVTIDISELPDSIYVIEIVTSDRKLTKRLTKHINK